MNAYAVRTLVEIEVYAGTEYEPDEMGYLFEIVFAESRTKARSKVCHHYNFDYMTPMSIRLLACDIDMSNRQHFASFSIFEDRALWIHAATKWHKMSDIEEWRQWQWLFEIEGFTEADIA